MSNPCACNVPSEANWHLFVVLTRYPYRSEGDWQSTETTYTDSYHCDDHLPCESDWQADYDSGRSEWEPSEWAEARLR